MDDDARSLVRSRANGRCEYCLLHEDEDGYLFHVEHIIPKKHRGESVPENLAYACSQCNLHKGTNLTGLDPDTGKLTEIFHPRLQKWEQHFRYNGPRLVGLTEVGRTTVYVLDINDADRVEQRELMSYDDGPAWLTLTRRQKISRDSLRTNGASETASNDESWAFITMLCLN